MIKGHPKNIQGIKHIIEEISQGTHHKDKSEGKGHILMTGIAKITQSIPEKAILKE